MKVNGSVVSGMDTVGCNSLMVQSMKVTGTLDMLMVTGSLCMFQSTTKHTKVNGLTTCVMARGFLFTLTGAGTKDNGIKTHKKVSV